MNYFLSIILAFCTLQGWAQTDTTVLPLAGTSVAGNTNIDLASPVLKENNSVSIQWHATNSKETGFYTIERSTDGTNFETIAVKKASSKTGHYEFTDDLPLSGNNFYRVKYSGKDSVHYSIVQSITVKSSFSCKFYPNPVGNVLIVKADKNITLYIADMSGKIRITKEVSPGIQFIDVSGIEKGYYILTLMQKDENKWITEKLIKN